MKVSRVWVCGKDDRGVQKKLVGAPSMWQGAWRLDVGCLGTASTVTAFPVSAEIILLSAQWLAKLKG